MANFDAIGQALNQAAGTLLGPKIKQNRLEDQMKFFQGLVPEGGTGLDPQSLALALSGLGGKGADPLTSLLQFITQQHQGNPFGLGNNRQQGNNSSRIDIKEDVDISKLPPRLLNETQSDYVKRTGVKF